MENFIYIETFTNSCETIERFEVYSYDVVITDPQMPDILGWNGTDD